MTENRTTIPVRREVVEAEEKMVKVSVKKPKREPKRTRKVLP